MAGAETGGAHRGERMKNVPWRYPFFGETLADEARQQLHGVQQRGREVRGGVFLRRIVFC